MHRKKSIKPVWNGVFAQELGLRALRFLTPLRRWGGFLDASLTLTSRHTPQHPPFFSPAVDLRSGWAVLTWKRGALGVCPGKRRPVAVHCAPRLRTGCRARASCPEAGEVLWTASPWKSCAAVLALSGASCSKGKSGRCPYSHNGGDLEAARRSGRPMPTPSPAPHPLYSGRSQESGGCSHSPRWANKCRHTRRFLTAALPTVQPYCVGTFRPLRGAVRGYFSGRAGGAL